MRLLRHLTFSNVLAALALFIALGGAAYAGSQVNGKTIVNGSIGGGKLRNETITAKKIKKGTITGAQIKAGSIDATQINLSTLGTVPSAQNATSAQTAQSATTAGNAKTADSATTAQTAINATNATEAETAAHADSAAHADEADTAKHAAEASTAANATNAAHATEATNAVHATEADRATLAGDAEKLEGKTAADLTVACGTGTEPYGGMCWDTATRPARFWLIAVKECGDSGGRLPTISELIAFVLRPGEQVEEQAWSGDLADTAGPTETVFTSDENGREARDGASVKHGYRCVFLPTN